MEISTLATGEYNLETKFNEIELIWELMPFQLGPYHNKSKNVQILIGVEEVLKQLQDHEMTLLTMLSSEFVGGIRKVILFFSSFFFVETLLLTSCIALITESGNAAQSPV
jgi:hypothetical protein